MNESTGGNPRRPALSALVVEPVLEDALLAVWALTDTPFRVTVAESFKEARTLISIRPPAC